MEHKYINRLMNWFYALSLLNKSVMTL